MKKTLVVEMVLVIGVKGVFFLDGATNLGPLITWTCNVQPCIAPATRYPGIVQLPC